MYIPSETLTESCSGKEGPGWSVSLLRSPGDCRMEEELEGSVLRWRSSANQNKGGHRT